MTIKKFYDYFEHKADMGVIGCGSTLEAAFIAAAEAVFAIMTDLPSLKSQQEVSLEFDEEDVELALVIWLNSLIVEARSQNLMFSRFELHRDHAHWRGKAWGELWRDELTHGVEVKGATLTMLSVKKIKDAWQAKCVVDV